MKVGDVVDYHGRRVEILDVFEAKAPLSGDLIAAVRVKDPRRGVRTMFAWQLEAGIGKPSELPSRDDSPFV